LLLKLLRFPELAASLLKMLKWTKEQRKTWNSIIEPKVQLESIIYFGTWFAFPLTKHNENFGDPSIVENTQIISNLIKLLFLFFIFIILISLILKSLVWKKNK